MNEQVSPPTYPKCFHAGKGRRIKANGQSADCGSYKNSFPRYFLHFAFFSPPLGPCVRSLNVATDDDRLDRSAALNPRSLARGVVGDKTTLKSDKLDRSGFGVRSRRSISPPPPKASCLFSAAVERRVPSFRSYLQCCFV